MSYFPYRKLFIGPQYAIAVAGNFFQIVCRTSGSLLARQNACPGVISAADVSWLLGKFVTTGDDKLLRVWAFKQDAEGNLAIELESSLEIPKKSSEIHITSDGQTILASDNRAKIRAQAQAAAGKVVEPDDDRPEEGGASDDGDENIEDVEMDDGTTPDPASTNTPTPQDVQLPHKFDPTAESFVVGKIGSIQVEAGGLVLFTVVGASGLFYFSLPQGSTSMIATPSVCAIDLGLPVLDFVVSTDNTPSLWVSVDGNWKGTDTESGEPKPMVRLLRWRDGQFVEDSDSSVGLLRGLNSNLVEGPVEMVSSLELYAQLAWLPKSREEEAEDNGETMGEEEARAASATPDIDDTNDTSPSVLTGNNGKKPVKKLAGRLKTRERLSKHHQGAGMKDESPVPKAGIEVEDLQVKKPKLSEDGKEESGPSVA
ncbi:tRNA (guanine-N(7)-)-methyltransferase non-catalytic subunit trm82 [Tulasnella sp. 403]|nr:tRNA (guanine-N(7)-)-methyltransferase non-catalytic subunit trm82 [Tulasnella sp. 403]